MSLVPQVWSYVVAAAPPGTVVHAPYPPPLSTRYSYPVIGNPIAPV